MYIVLLLLISAGLAAACRLRSASDHENLTMVASADGGVSCYEPVFFTSLEAQARPMDAHVQAAGALKCGADQCVQPWWWLWSNEITARCRLEPLLPSEERAFEKQRESERLQQLMVQEQRRFASHAAPKAPPIYFEHQVEYEMVETPNGPAKWRCFVYGMVLTPRALVCRHHEPEGRPHHTCILDCGEDAFTWMWIHVVDFVLALTIACVLVGTIACLWCCACIPCYARWCEYRARAAHKKHEDAGVPTHSHSQAQTTNNVYVTAQYRMPHSASHAAMSRAHKQDEAFDSAV